eukprot:GHVT01034600.1.p1 GENE.GHVT01034600.1~~GHVT01034600.1.p1  ORF type:complete len:734 (+),score=170.09 GHVT01034600.1:165-2366(+)
MSTFRDTFTKGEKNEPLLNYDNSASLYFGGTMLLCLLIPWSLLVLRNCFFPSSFLGAYPGQSKKGSVVRYCQCSFCATNIENTKATAISWKTKASPAYLCQILLLTLVWALFFLLCSCLQDMPSVQRFDPFTILELSTGATDREIRKAYRRMSLKFHPDKNANDPAAAARFIMISKAYASLTDELSKANFEKYGNPDGPGVMKVGIGLPMFLVQEEYQLLFLCLFFLVLLVIIPMAIIAFYRRQKKYAPNGVQIETLHFLTFYLREGTRLRHLSEYFAASGESRELAMRQTDDLEMKEIIARAVEPKKRTFSIPIIVRNYFLILCHCQRLHSFLSKSLQEDLDQLLRASIMVTQSMIEIAAVQDWIFTCMSCIEFRRSLIQGLDSRSSSLLQIPHFCEATLKHCHRGKNAVKELAEFLRQSPEERKGLSSMNAQQLADVQAFCMQVSSMEVKAVVEVDDEAEVVVGDVATCRVTMTRENLKEGESAGPVHAPLFPLPKFEEWWLFLVDKSDANAAGGHVICWHRCKSLERVVTERLQFQVSKAGKHSMELIALCDSYAGCDRVVKVEFKALTVAELPRPIYVHPEDMELDNEPTLFQQMLGDVCDAAQSSDEEEMVAMDKTRPGGVTVLPLAKPSAKERAKKGTANAGQQQTNDKQGKDVAKGLKGTDGNNLCKQDEDEKEKETEKEKEKEGGEVEVKPEKEQEGTQDENETDKQKLQLKQQQMDQQEQEKLK